uniref:Copper transport protein n=1 Tax=Globisporangium ultimum (strain ATCC 200006 / CBS 805.95 / DAOM BR144) TaxID=431595 RepID=K3WW85_GLOUD
MAPFCMGSGVTMGTTGLKWAGADPADDCSMLWTQLLGVTSVGRAVIASVAVFLMALSAQYLTTRSGNKIQEAKEFAKRQRMATLTTSRYYYDSEIGRGHRNTSSNGNGSGIPAFTRSESTSRQAASSERQPATIAQRNNGGAHVSSTGSVQGVPATITSVSISSRSIPAPTTATWSTTALPGSKYFSNDNSINTNTAVASYYPAKVSDWEHFGDSLLRGLRMSLAYLLMLAVMTYDVALIGSVVLGFSLGYFLFAQDTAKIPASADPCCS